MNYNVYLFRFLPLGVNPFSNSRESSISRTSCAYANKNSASFCNVIKKNNEKKNNSNNNNNKNSNDGDDDDDDKQKEKVKKYEELAFEIRQMYQK